MAYTGFYVNGYCYPTTADALDGFRSLYPFPDPSFATNGYHYLSASSITAAGVVTFTDHKSSTNGIVFNNSKVQLQVCDPASPYGLASTQTALASAFQFDRGSFDLAITGIFLLFAVGLGVGLIIGQVRKTRV